MDFMVMTKELEMHEQEDGSFISDPAPYDGVFLGTLRSGKLLWACNPGRTLNAGETIVIPSPSITLE